MTTPIDPRGAWSPFTDTGAPALVRFAAGDVLRDMQSRVVDGTVSLSMDQVSQVKLTLSDYMDHDFARSRVLTQGTHLHAAGVGFTVSSWDHKSTEAGPTTEVVALSGGVTRLRQITGAASWGKVSTSAWFRTEPGKLWKAWRYIVDPGLGRQVIIREVTEDRRENMWEVMTHAAENAEAYIFEYGSTLVVGRLGWLASTQWGQKAWRFQWDGWGTGSASLAGMPALSTDADGVQTMSMELVSATRRQVRPGDRVQIDGHTAHRVGLGGSWLVHDVDMPWDPAAAATVKCIRVPRARAPRLAVAAEARGGAGLAAPPKSLPVGSGGTATTRPPTQAPPPAAAPAPPRPAPIVPPPPATPSPVPKAPAPTPVERVGAVKPLPGPIVAGPSGTVVTQLPEGRPVEVKAAAAERVLATRLKNAPAIVAAARRAGLALNVAAAKVEKESGGLNIYGHDVGGAMYVPRPQNVEVTEANYLGKFMPAIESGQLSNGVGPGQITWKPLHYQAREEGLKLWLPEDNLFMGSRIMAKNMKDRGGNIAEAGTLYNAGTLKNGVTAYGRHLDQLAREWHARLIGAPTPPPPPATPPPSSPNYPGSPVPFTPWPAGWAARWVPLTSAATGRITMWPDGKVAGTGGETGTSITKTGWDELWAWVLEVRGRSDITGKYGMQCVDLSKHWGNRVQGLRMAGSYGHGKDLARGLASTGLFTFYPASAQAQSGDVVSWGASWGRGYGHTAVVIADNGSSLRVMQQNPLRPHLATLSKRDLVGYARPVKLDKRR